MPFNKYNSESDVERRAILNSPFDEKYAPIEKIRTIVVDNFPDLGKLAALRFIEWIQKNPEGVISLPTGKTPEFFIKWVNYYLETWKDKKTQSELEKNGLDPGIFPKMKSLSFVQIDEFYPINPSQHNSFYYYINHFYIDGFGLDPEKAYLINCSDIELGKGKSIESIWPDNEVDLSLRYRTGKNELEIQQKIALEHIDQWCQDYENKIRSLGGIGFFMGGIGPDGHIGFNVRGSDHYSTTRLTETNYETQASAAGDLGGIEISRKRLVITIGLGTIAYNTDCASIIIAAGEAKAGIVASAIQNEKSTLSPATVLQELPYSAFYITHGAAKHLIERQYTRISKKKSFDKKKIEEIIVDLSLKKEKPVLTLTKEDFNNDSLAAELLKKTTVSHNEYIDTVHNSLAQKIEKGMNTSLNKRFLHTEPHHDDLMLGCLPYIVRHVRSARNTHYFVTLTSGFTAVSNSYMQKIINHVKGYIRTDIFTDLYNENYFDPENDIARSRDIWQYLDSVASNSIAGQRNGTSRRFIRNIISVFGDNELVRIKLHLNELEHYFNDQYPGQIDSKEVQKLKGMCREWEAECLWGYFGWESSYILHLRLGFYTGEIFTEEPALDRDVKPIVEVFKKTNPDIITMALDPEASGPDTHYKVLQALTEALKLHESSTGRKDIKVLGYRNVWYRFHPSEADIIVPVSLNMFSIMQSAFMSTFISQKDASFPSFEHDGPFSELAQKIQVEEFSRLKTCLGRSWFYEHKSPLIKATRGLVFLNEMSLDQLYNHSRALRLATENK